MRLPVADRGDPLQHLLRPIHDWIVDEFAVELDRGAALGFSFREGPSDALGEDDLPPSVGVKTRFTTGS